MSINLPQAFKQRMQKQLGQEYQAFLATYDLPAQRGIRVNSLKISAEEFEKISPFQLERVPWEHNGYYITESKAGKFIEHFAGLYYCQEPSAMSVVPLLGVKQGDIVLDMCSAPGGKGTQLAQKMCGKGTIVLNEVNLSRAKILSSNVERLGISNAIVTSMSVDALVENFGAVFDCILVDAPCSGEGMFKKEELAIENWSEQNIATSVRRQHEILSCAYKLLKNGGKIAYSTCTFSPEEDEQTAEWFAEEYGMHILEQHKLYPHKVRGEGHFVTIFQKESGENEVIQTERLPKVKFADVFLQFAKQTLNVQMDNLFVIKDNLYSLPQDCLHFSHISYAVLRCGVHLGQVVKGRFEPSHSLAMALKKQDAQNVELDEATARRYLHGETFNCSPDLSGWTLACYKNFPLGWCKCVNGVAKNHLPKGLRSLQ